MVFFQEEQAPCPGPQYLACPEPQYMEDHAYPEQPEYVDIDEGRPRCGPRSRDSRPGDTSRRSVVVSFIAVSIGLLAPVGLFCLAASMQTPGQAGSRSQNLRGASVSLAQTPPHNNDGGNIYDLWRHIPKPQVTYHQLAGVAAAGSVAGCWYGIGHLFWTCFVCIANVFGLCWNGIGGCCLAIWNILGGCICGLWNACGSMCGGCCGCFWACGRCVGELFGAVQACFTGVWNIIGGCCGGTYWLVGNFFAGCWTACGRCLDSVCC
mmetsp:Transcript_83789/g.237641  ORF Transcript_83789/g.237641 Transcript_83789/m.237641 type:complete len:265 (+) Transcript_83789:81-875(+)